MDAVIQENASSSEQIAQMSQELLQQSDFLYNAVNYFHIEDQTVLETDTLLMPPDRES